MKRILLGLVAGLAAMSQSAAPPTKEPALTPKEQPARNKPARKVYVGTGGRLLVRHVKPSTWNQRKARKRLRQVSQLYKKKSLKNKG